MDPSGPAAGDRPPRQQGMVPDPRRFGGDTGGPSHSVQLMVKVSSPVRQSRHDAEHIFGVMINLRA